MGFGKNIPPRSDKSFSGKWQGQYTYGANYGPRLKGKSAPFTVLLEVEGSGKVTGECLDDGYADQIDAKAAIEGRLINGRIEFVKKYRRYWQTDEIGNVRETDKREGHEVHYAGDYRHGVFSGEWKIFTVFLHPDGRLTENEFSGYWIMHRVD